MAKRAPSVDVKTDLEEMSTAALVAIETRPDRVEAVSIALRDLEELIANARKVRDSSMLSDAERRVTHIRDLLGL